MEGNRWMETERKRGGLENESKRHGTENTPPSIAELQD